MNASRVYTILLKQKGMNDVFSVGRVQTPTLALIVRREKEIEQFRPEPFWEVVATFDVNGKRYEGKWWHENETRTYDQQLAEKVSAFCRGKQVEIEEVTCERKRFYHRFCLIYQHYKQQPTSDLDIHHKKRLIYYKSYIKKDMYRIRVRIHNMSRKGKRKRFRIF